MRSRAATDRVVLDRNEAPRARSFRALGNDFCSLPFGASGHSPDQLAASKRLYRRRNCIEQVLGHLKVNCAIATRYDQLTDSFLGMLYLATARYWISLGNRPDHPHIGWVDLEVAWNADRPG